MINIGYRTLARTKSTGQQNWTPLSVHLSNRTITAKEIHKIVHEITQTVADFHAVGLITDDFGMDDIHVIATAKVGTDRRSNALQSLCCLLLNDMSSLSYEGHFRSNKTVPITLLCIIQFSK